jgi:hypothetical protein
MGLDGFARALDGFEAVVAGVPPGRWVRRPRAKAGAPPTSDRRDPMRHRPVRVATSWG